MGNCGGSDPATETVARARMDASKRSLASKKGMPTSVKNQVPPPRSPQPDKHSNRKNTDNSASRNRQSQKPTTPHKQKPASPLFSNDTTMYTDTSRMHEGKPENVLDVSTTIIDQQIFKVKRRSTVILDSLASSQRQLTAKKEELSGRKTTSELYALPNVPPIIQSTVNFDSPNHEVLLEALQLEKIFDQRRALFTYCQSGAQQVAEIAKRQATEAQVVPSRVAQLFEQDEGIQKFDNGDSLYKGQVINGMVQGYGQWELPDGKVLNVYQGENGVSLGVCDIQDGGYYRGEFQGTSFNGYGQFLSNDGDDYTGAWITDTPEGLGVHLDIQGRKYEGLFSGAFECGIVTLPDGSVKEVDFMDDKSSGYLCQWDLSGGRCVVEKREDGVSLSVKTDAGGGKSVLISYKGEERQIAID